MHPWQGPFQITAIKGPLNVEIMNIQNKKRPREIVHITKLKLYKEPLDLQVTYAVQEEVQDDQLQQEDNKVEEEEEYKVEKILDHRKKNKENQYLVKWVGYEEPTWEREPNLEHLQALKEYQVAHRPHYMLRRANQS